MSKNQRFLTKSCIFLALFGLAYFLTGLATWDFTFVRLQTTHDLGFISSGDDPRAYLSQKFYLRDQGGQSYVFISADNKIVLKFFKDMPRPWVPFSHYHKKKFGKLKRTLKGYDLAFHRLREETGLLSLHLAPSSSPLPAILIDRLNIEHNVDLSSTYFILQKKADPLPSDPKVHLPQILELLKKRAAAKISDHDPRLHRNLGLLDNHPVFIDPGRFVEDDHASSELPAKFLKFVKI